MTKKNTISSYLLNTQYSVKKLLELIIEADKNIQLLNDTKESRELIELKYAELAYEQSEGEFYERRDAAIIALLEFDELYSKQGITYSNIINIVKYSENVSEIKASAEVLSGSVLQIAKQGISSIYGVSKYDCELVGKKHFGSATLLDVIWEGRNQSSHYEDRKFDEGVDQCFNALIEYNNVFIDYKKGKNMAYEIIKLLNWLNYKEYQNDMLTFEKL